MTQVDTRDDQALQPDGHRSALDENPHTPTADEMTGTAEPAPARPALTGRAWEQRVAAMNRVALAPLRVADVVRGRFDPELLDANRRWQHAERLSKARYTTPRIYHGAPGDVYSVLDHAMALDIPGSIALQHLYYSQREQTFGTVGLKAALMNALLLRAGWRVILLSPPNSGRTCVMRLERPDGTVTPQTVWHILEAQRNNLVKPNSAWMGYPADLLFARCLSRAIRRYAANITHGLHTPEELDQDVSVEDIDALAAEYGEFDGEGVEVSAEALELLGRAEGATLDQLRHMFQVEAPASGLRTAYAGTVAGIHRTVEEVLWDLMDAARKREDAAGTLTGTPAETPTWGDRQHLTDVHQADAQDLAEERAQEGQHSGNFECGCSRLYVRDNRNHAPGCPKRRRGRRSTQQ